MYPSIQAVSNGTYKFRKGPTKMVKSNWSNLVVTSYTAPPEILTWNLLPYMADSNIWIPISSFSRLFTTPRGTSKPYKLLVKYTGQGKELKRTNWALRNICVIGKRRDSGESGYCEGIEWGRRWESLKSTGACEGSFSRVLSGWSWDLASVEWYGRNWLKERFWPNGTWRMVINVCRDPVYW